MKQICDFWGGRGRKFKSCHSDQKSVRMYNSCGFFLLFLFTFNTFQVLFLFATFLVHTKYIQPRVCTRFTKGMYLIHGQILEKPYKSRTFGFSPLPFAKVEVLTCDLYSNFHDKICFASTQYSFEWYRLISSKSENNYSKVFLYIPCSL